MAITHRTHAALMVDGRQYGRRVPVTMEISLDGTMVLQRGLRFNVRVAGHGEVVFFMAPTGDEWLARYDLGVVHVGAKVQWNLESSARGRWVHA